MYHEILSEERRTVEYYHENFIINLLMGALVRIFGIIVFLIVAGIIDCVIDFLFG